MTKKYRHLLFDLDGTLTDPMEGITRSVQHALRHFGIEVSDLRELCPFIGPPFAESFRTFYFKQSLIENGIGFTKKQIEEQLNKFDKTAQADTSDALALWDTLSYDRRRGQNDIVTRVSCLIVNYDTNRIEQTTIENAVSSALKLIENWAEK